MEMISPDMKNTCFIDGLQRQEYIQKAAIFYVTGRCDEIENMDLDHDSGVYIMVQYIREIRRIIVKG